MKSTKKAFITLSATITATSIMAGLTAGPAFASTTYYGTNIYASGKLVSSPKHINAMDSGNLTAFLPLYYVNQALAQYGITGTWNGNTWNLSLPQGMNVDMSNLQTGQQSDSYTLSMSINGTIVQYAPRQTAVDPSGRTETTYLPIWYIDQVLGRLSIQASWNGTSWSMVQTTPATKLQTVKDFMSTLGITGDPSGTNPYDDVSAVDWPVVHKTIEDGYFTPDSPTHFGSADSVSVSEVDHAYQLSIGIPDSHMTWNAGGNTIAWGTAINLNKGVPTNVELSTLSENQIMHNLSDLNQGWSKDADGVYHLWFQPYDGYTDFEPATPGLPQSEVQQDMASSIQHMDDITFTINGDMATFHLDGLSDQSSDEITCSTYSIPLYSLNNARTWTKATGIYGYDSRDDQNGGRVDAPSNVLVMGSQLADIDAYVITQDNDWVFTGAEVSFSNSAITSVKYARAE